MEPITLALLYGTLAVVAAVGILLLVWWPYPKKQVRTHPEILDEAKREAAAIRLLHSRAVKNEKR